MGVFVKKSEELDPSLTKNDHGLINQNLTKEELSVKCNECYNCGDKTLSRVRCFSEKAWSVLLHWKEISATTVQKPICDYCYSELRAILMERMDEMDEVLTAQKSESLEL